MRNTRVWLLLLCLLPALAPAQRRGKDPTPFCATERFLATVPLTYENHVLYFTATLNGKPYNFFFDTGAMMVIRPEVADELSLTDIGTAQTTDVNGVVRELRRVRIDSMEVGGAVFRNVPAIVNPLNASAELACAMEGTGGIFGIQPFLGLSLQWNYRDLQLRITDLPDTLLRTPSAIAYTYKPRNTGTPMVSLTVFGKKIKDVTFDTGSSGAIGLGADEADKLLGRRFGMPLATGRGVFSSGLFGGQEETVRYTYAPVTYVGDIPLGSQRVGFDEASSQTIGNRVWEYFHVTLHTATRTLLLAPLDSIPTLPPVMESYGFRPIFKDGKLQVGALFENSSATEAGLRVGAFFEYFNGVDVSRFGLTDYCALLKEEFPPEIEVVVVQNGLKQRLRLRKRNLLAP